MFDRILIAVDGSEQSCKAVDWAKALATMAHGDVLVLHVREREVGRAGIFDLESPDEAHELVDGIVRDLKDAGVSARGDIRPGIYGHAAREILAAAKEFDGDVIVMGSRGLSDFSALLLGSVTHKVIHLAECPVLVIR